MGSVIQIARSAAVRSHFLPTHRICALWHVCRHRYTQRRSEFQCNMLMRQLSPQRVYSNMFAASKLCPSVTYPHTTWTPLPTKTWPSLVSPHFLLGNNQSRRIGSTSVGTKKASGRHCNHCGRMTHSIPVHHVELSGQDEGSGHSSQSCLMSSV